MSCVMCLTDFLLCHNWDISHWVILTKKLNALAGMYPPCAIVPGMGESLYRMLGSVQDGV